MPRKKSTSAETDSSSSAQAADNVVPLNPQPAEAEPETQQTEAPEGRNWGNPYKALVTTASFEMGENRLFKQRVFKFREKPADEILATLKENGFTYRPNEKAWTIPANPDTRRLTDQLAEEFGGASLGMKR